MIRVLGIAVVLLFSVLAKAQERPSPENIILTLNCNVSYESSKGNEGFKPDGGLFSFSFTIYKKNNVYYIKQQDGAYNPYWWGQGMNWSGLSYTVSNIANLDAETIWARSTTKSSDGILNEHDLEINRLNGAIRGRSKYPKTEYKPETNILMSGRCMKTSNAF